ncbi:hypothetical protein ILYODFUR_002074, partial [Ilyodon furcidens]
ICSFIFLPFMPLLPDSPQAARACSWDWGEEVAGNQRCEGVKGKVGNEKDRSEAPTLIPRRHSRDQKAAGKTQRREVCNWCDKARNILLFRRQHNELETQLGGGEKKNPQNRKNNR